MGESLIMSQKMKQAAEVVVLGARLYRELAISAMTLLPGRRVAA